MASLVLLEQDRGQRLSECDLSVCEHACAVVLVVVVLNTVHMGLHTL